MPQGSATSGAQVEQITVVYTYYSNDNLVEGKWNGAPEAYWSQNWENWFTGSYPFIPATQVVARNIWLSRQQMTL